MSDQKKLLFVAGLMAIVLFVSWQLLGGAGSGDGDTAGHPDMSQAETLAEDGGSEGSTGITDEAGLPDTSEAAADTTQLIVEPVDREITVIIQDHGENIVEARITTMGGAITSWKLLQYEDMPGAGQGGSVDFCGTPWLGRGQVFATDAPDTLIVGEQLATISMLSAEGGRLEYTFIPDYYGFIVESEGLSEVTSISAGVLPVSEQNAPQGRYFKAEWNAEKIRSKRSGDIEGVEPVGNLRWIATRSQYFAIIMMPETMERAYGYLYPTGEGQSPAIGLSDTRVRIFAGPLDYGLLRELGGDTHRLVDFGWPFIREIGRLLFWFCNSALSFVGNWGIKIILLALVLKIVLLPLTQKSFRSMQKMKQVQPKMKAIQEKFKSDPKAQQAAMQSLYREEGVNPLGGCLPLILQMPVFFALYRVLANSVQLRGAPFMLWIRDLSRPEILVPFGSPILGLHGLGLLAILMGVAMFFQQKMTMTDQKQKGMLYMMPIFMTFLFMRFPAGLTLYWFINNILTIGQQEMIKRKLELKEGRAS